MMLLAAIVQPTIEKAHRAIDEVQRVRNFKICLSCVYLCVSGYMIRPLVILTILILFISCDRAGKKPEPKIVSIPKQIDILEPDHDTLPNGKRLLDNMDSGMVHYYKEVVGSDTLKGGYISCYGIDDSTKYFYLRHGDTLHLLNQTPIYTSTWSLGTLEKDFNTFILTRVDNGNGVPATYQIFDKLTGENILGKDVEAWNYKTFNDSLFFLYDNHTVNLIGNYIDRKPADSIYLYNAVSGRRKGFKLPKEIPYDSYLDLKRITKNILTISWVQIMTNDDEKLVTYSR